MNKHRRAKLWRTTVLVIVTSALLLVWVLPLLWAFVVSLKSEREVLAYPPSVIFETTWKNYADALFGDFSILDSLMTSAIVATSTTLLTILLAVPAAYAFAMQEMLEQGHSPDWIVFASSSGGTQAGLMAGARLFGFEGKILGISVDEPRDVLRERVAGIA